MLYCPEGARIEEKITVGLNADAKLPRQYTIFGHVSSGMEAVDAIAAVPTDRADKPTSDCVIRSVAITEG